MAKDNNSYINLSDGELAYLVKQSDDLAFNELAMRYLKTINYIARKFNAQGYEHSDFIQEGLLAMLYACRTYSDNENASFKTYMEIIIQRRFVSIIRKNNTQKTVPSTNLVQISEIYDELPDEKNNPEQILLCNEHLNSVNKKLKSMLSKTEYNVLILYGNGYTYAQIAKALSISTKSADNALQRVRKKINDRDMS